MQDGQLVAERCQQPNQYTLHQVRSLSPPQTGAVPDSSSHIEGGWGTLLRKAKLGTQRGPVRLPAQPQTNREAH